MTCGSPNTNVQPDGKVRDVDPEFERRCRHHSPEVAISQGVLDSRPVLRLVAAPVGFHEVAVIGPYRQPLSPLAGIDEGDELPSVEPSTSAL